VLQESHVGYCGAGCKDKCATADTIPSSVQLRDKWWRITPRVQVTASERRAKAQG
jgi:hypothetical protein